MKVDDDDHGLLVYDPAFLNTASCTSRITYIDGDRGVLLYRGYPIEQLAEQSNFLETAYLLIHGELPNAAEYAAWEHDITIHTLVHENVKSFMDGFHHDAHPMGMLLSTVGALSTFYPDSTQIYDEEQRRISIYRLIAKMPTLAAFAYRHSRGLPYNYPDNDLSYAGNFLSMMFKMVEPRYQRGAGDRARARRALHPPCRPRAELLDQRDARGGLVTPRPVLRDRGGDRGPVRTAARRRQRGGDPHGGAHRFTSTRSPSSSPASRRARND